MWLAPDAAPPPAPPPPAAPSAPAPAEPPPTTPDAEPIAEPEPPTLTGEFAQGLEDDGTELVDEREGQGARVAAGAPSGPFVQATGLAFEFRVESGTAFLGPFDMPESSITLPTWNAGLFVGYMGTTFTFGAGLDLTRTSAKSSVNGPEEELTITSFLIAPGMRVVFARSADRRTQLLGQLDLGIGGLFLGDGDDLTEEDPSYDRLRFQIAPALRHWISPAFAVGATVGLRYDNVSRVADVGAGFSGEESHSTTGLFGSLQVSAVF